MPGDQELPSHEVLAALVASLRRELAEAMIALEQARAELAGTRERIAELEARLRQNPRNSSKPKRFQAPDQLPIEIQRGQMGTWESPGWSAGIREINSPAGWRSR